MVILVSFAAPFFRYLTELDSSHTPQVRCLVIWDPLVEMNFHDPRWKLINSPRRNFDFPNGIWFCFVFVSYGCGAGREFKEGEAHHPIQKMTCQWNREWTPKPTIPVTQPYFNYRTFPTMAKISIAILICIRLSDVNVVFLVSISFL